MIDFVQQIADACKDSFYGVLQLRSYRNGCVAVSDCGFKVKQNFLSVQIFSLFICLLV